MSSERGGPTRSILTLCVIGAALITLGGVNLWIGRDKATDYDVNIVRLERAAEDADPDTSPRDLENARGKRAFYLGVQQAGWWLVAGGLAFLGVGLAVAWIEQRPARTSAVDDARREG
ncbi:MAG: hypothetical protein U0610_05280 [bacterium]